ncbi:MAG TPA: OmpA family protein [Puia sp.]|nr:OmpA family protein [Puia sp.]
MRSVYLLFIAAAFSFVACVSAGRFKAAQRQASLSDSLYNQSMRTLKSCQDDNSRLSGEKSTLQQQNKDMTQQLSAAAEVNTQLRKQLQDLSAVSSAQAESIRRSLDNMGARDSYMIALHSAIAYRDSVNLVVLFELKQSIGGYGEKDVAIRLEKGAVHVDLSDSLLFNGDSAGYAVSDKAKPVLGRLARALNDEPEVDLMVEGHVDSLPPHTDSLPDNWDLGIKRAAAVVRVLQDDRVSPNRMTAAARNEWSAVAAADSTSGPARPSTRILIVPKTDRLMQVLEHGQQTTPPPAAPATSATSATPAARVVSGS